MTITLKKKVMHLVCFIAKMKLLHLFHFITNFNNNTVNVCIPDYIYFLLDNKMEQTQRDLNTGHPNTRNISIPNNLSSRILIWFHMPGLNSPTIRIAYRFSKGLEPDGHHPWFSFRIQDW
jgi:hypothetical protein